MKQFLRVDALIKNISQNKHQLAGSVRMVVAL